MVRHQHKLRSVLGCHEPGPLRLLDVSWCVMLRHDSCYLPDGQDMRGFPWHVLTIRQMTRIMTMTHQDTSSGLRAPDPWHLSTLLSFCCGARAFIIRSVALRAWSRTLVFGQSIECSSVFLTCSATADAFGLTR